MDDDGGSGSGSAYVFTGAYTVLPGPAGGNGPGGVGVTDGSSPLELWLRADKEVYEDVACTDDTEATDGVACWQDQSGYGRHFTQSDSNFRPSYSTSGQNGLPVLTLDGLNDRLTYLDAVLGVGDDTFSYFAAWKSNRIGLQVVYEQNNPFGQMVVGKRAGLMAYETNDYGFNGEGNDFRAASYVPGQYYVSSIVLNGQTVGDNVLVSSQGTTYLNQINMSLQEVSTTGGSAVGYKITTAGEFFDGNIPEVIVFSDEQIAVERILVENYLSAKYGVAMTVNDVYDGDANDVNHNFDLDMAGIGQYD